MCGIGGYIALKQGEVSRDLLDSIAEPLFERGPDAIGYFVKGNVGLVHRRLSIIDLSTNANQPFETEQSIIVLNGEIYNFKTLKIELEEKGVRFVSSSDTEVLLQYFNVFGIDKTLAAADGMFAFCIYDKKNEKIILGRDPVGKKPLYYYFSENKFVFSSDIRSFKKLDLDLSVDRFAFSYFLYEGASPQPHSIYSEVNQVRSGNYLILDLKTKELKEKEYFQFSVSEPKDRSNESKNIITEVEGLLRDAIQKRLIADRPLGAFLSGGIDSSLIVSLMSQMTSEPVKTFTIGFKNDSENELHLAKLVANKYKTNHHEIEVDFNVADLVEELLDYFGEPFADASLLPTYIISKQIKKQVAVVLSGDGGDEIFCGYQTFVIADQAQKVIDRASESNIGYLELTKQRVLNRLFKKQNNLPVIQGFIKSPIEERLFRYMGFLPSEQKKFNKLFNSDFLTELRAYLELNWRSNVSFPNSLSYSYLKGRLLNSYLVKVDRMSMKNSIEVRCPMLDKTLIQYMLDQSSSSKMGERSIRKYLLFELGKKYLPDELLNAKKRGFGVPIDKLMQKDLKQLFGDTVLSSDRVRSFLDLGYIEKLFWMHQRGEKKLGYELWNVLSLSNWINKTNEV